MYSVCYLAQLGHKQRELSQPGLSYLLDLRKNRLHKDLRPRPFRPRLYCQYWAFLFPWIDILDHWPKRPTILRRGLSKRVESNT